MQSLPEAGTFQPPAHRDNDACCDQTPKNNNAGINAGIEETKNTDSASVRLTADPKQPSSANIFSMGAIEPVGTKDDATTPVTRLSLAQRDTAESALAVRGSTRKGAKLLQDKAFQVGAATLLVAIENKEKQDDARSDDARSDDARSDDARSKVSDAFERRSLNSTQLAAADTTNLPEQAGEKTSNQKDEPPNTQLRPAPTTDALPEEQSLTPVNQALRSKPTAKAWAMDTQIFCIDDPRNALFEFAELILERHPAGRRDTITQQIEVTFKPDTFKELKNAIKTQIRNSEKSLRKLTEEIHNWENTTKNPTKDAQNLLNGIIRNCQVTNIKALKAVQSDNQAEQEKSTKDRLILEGNDLIEEIALRKRLLNEVLALELSYSIKNHADGKTPHTTWRNADKQTKIAFLLTLHSLLRPEDRSRALNLSCRELVKADNLVSTPNWLGEKMLLSLTRWFDYLVGVQGVENLEAQLANNQQGVLALFAPHATLTDNMPMLVALLHMGQSPAEAITAVSKHLGETDWKSPTSFIRAAFYHSIGAFFITRPPSRENLLDKLASREEMKLLNLLSLMGYHQIIFPQGKRTMDGPPRKGTLHAACEALEAGLPVIIVCSGQEITKLLNRGEMLPKAMLRLHKQLKAGNQVSFSIAVAPIELPEIEVEDSQQSAIEATIARRKHIINHIYKALVAKLAEQGITVNENDTQATNSGDKPRRSSEHKQQSGSGILLATLSQLRRTSFGVKAAFVVALLLMAQNTLFSRGGLRT